MLTVQFNSLTIALMLTKLISTSGYSQSMHDIKLRNEQILNIVETKKANTLSLNREVTSYFKSSSHTTAYQDSVAYTSYKNYFRRINYKNGKRFKMKHDGQDFWHITDSSKVKGSTPRFLLNDSLLYEQLFYVFLNDSCYTEKIKSNLVCHCIYEDESITYKFDNKIQLIEIQKTNTYNANSHIKTKLYDYVQFDGLRFPTRIDQVSDQLETQMKILHLELLHTVPKI